MRSNALLGRTDPQFLPHQTREDRLVPLGEDHPNYAIALRNYARCLDASGNYSEAEDVYRQARVAIATAFGNPSAEYDVCLFQLASLYDDIGRYSEAESLYREELEVSRQVWGADHPSHAATLSNLGLLYININDMESALSAFDTVN